MSDTNGQAKPERCLQPEEFETCLLHTMNQVDANTDKLEVCNINFTALLMALEEKGVVSRAVVAAKREELIRDLETYASEFEANGNPLAPEVGTAERILQREYEREQDSEGEKE